MKQLATLVGIPTEQLLSQMAGAGIAKASLDDVVTDDEKQALLAHIRSGQAKVSAEPAKVTLRRKSISTIKAGAGAVNVEVRKKRTYVHRDLTAEAEKKREAEATEALELQESEERIPREAEESTQQVEEVVELIAELPVAKKLDEKIVPEISTPLVMEPPPPPKESDGKRHKKDLHVRRERPDGDGPRR